VASTVDPLGDHSDTVYDSGGNPTGAMAFQLQGAPPMQSPGCTLKIPITEGA